jgi:hypothetical protein
MNDSSASTLHQTQRQLPQPHQRPMKVNDRTGNVTVNVVEDYMSFDEFFPTTLEYGIIRCLEVVCPPVLIVVGCAGNGFVTAVLGRPAFRCRAGGCSASGQVPAAGYLTALCVANMIHLVLGRGLDWFVFITGLPSLVETTDAMCRLWHGVSGVIRHSAGWLIVTMLAERYVASNSHRSPDIYCIVSHMKVRIYMCIDPLLKFEFTTFV